MVSKSNKRGVIIIAVIALMITYTPRFIMFVKGEDRFIISSFKKKNRRDTTQLLFLNEKSSKVNSKSNSFKKESRYNRPNNIFNPNNYLFEDWINLGLSSKQTTVILSFLKSGARSNEDLKKIYVLPEELYELIKDSTFYDNQLKKDQPLIIISDKEVIVELNASNEKSLIEIKGIGPFYATQIIKRRNELGGYYSKKQLLEVWKLDTVLLKQLENHIEIDTLLIKKINLNTVTKEELKTHPYFGWNLSNSIVQIRKLKGSFVSVNEILESKLMSDSIFYKVKPYLIVK